MKWAYSDEVAEHFFRPKNVLFEDESLFPHNARGMSGNVICGDQMLMLLHIADDIIEDIRWKTYGCASAIASTSVLSEMVKGMDIFAAAKITPAQIAARLGGLPAHKKHCSVMGDEALLDAINNYLAAAGRELLKKVKKSTPGSCAERSTVVTHGVKPGVAKGKNGSKTGR
ncbi:MAG: iron-sulfur cluster assembly scaffold protein [Candidatus Nomurabacteria bacterium]|jgi:nitrogen fixation NifU-like protein|nr:iron-sulfur cluster assembly scaffold protein [Candidatus Nomurabacteria bacterium]